MIPAIILSQSDGSNEAAMDVDQANGEAAKENPSAQAARYCPKSACNRLWFIKRDVIIADSVGIQNAVEGGNRALDV